MTAPVREFRLAALEQDFKRCGIRPKIYRAKFSKETIQQIPRVNGLYSIWQQERCIYVGRSNSSIRGRLDKHHQKAHGTINEKGDTRGWEDGRLQEWWSPDDWEIEFFVCERNVQQMYLEGTMALLFDPWCNSESYADRLIPETIESQLDRIFG